MRPAKAVARREVAVATIPSTVERVVIRTAVFCASLVNPAILYTALAPASVNFAVATALSITSSEYPFNVFFKESLAVARISFFVDLLSNCEKISTKSLLSFTELPKFVRCIFLCRIIKQVIGLSFFMQYDIVVKYRRGLI